MWKVIGDNCFFNECGDGCGPDNKTTFGTEAACRNALGPPGEVKTECTGFQKLGYVEHNFYAIKDELRIVLKNNIGSRINLGTATVEMGDKTDLEATPPGYTILEDETFTLSFIGDNLRTAGTPYTATVKVLYATLNASGISESGVCTGKFL
jgi:hypothetical protein